ncbi:fatty acid hydroxylase [Parasaccharibacter sp. TMW 2.1886]|nr:fatty acid hydroxylase [Parasaccharibacter sp. TMW 2.1886]
MSKSSSRLIRVSDPANSLTPNHKVSAKEPPVRIFQKDWMEAFTLISFRKFVIYCIAFESILFFSIFHTKTPLMKFIITLLIGLFFWLLFEYILHRFAFHFVSNNKKVQRLIYIFHGNHHIQPNHPFRTLMPIIVTLPIGLFIWSISIYSIGFSLGTSFFIGFFSGYAIYDTIHYATHNFKMRKFPLSLWKKHHLLHHYRTEEHNYSISLPFLDSIFRTKYKK